LITLGRPAKDIQRTYNQLYPIAVYLGERLQAQGITGGDVVLEGKNSRKATIKLIQTGKIDLLFETPYSALHFIKEAGVIPLLSIARNGNALEYRSLIFTRQDAGIKRLDNLIGHVIAFEDPGSTSAYHLPRTALEAAGLELVALPSPEAEVPNGKVGYVFAGSELNISSWVYFQRTDAGALSNLDWYSQDENPEAFRKDFAIIYETRPIPRMLVLVRPDLAPEFTAAVKHVLLAMPHSEAGRQALKGFDISHFYPIEDAETYIKNLENSLTHTAN
jgi:phosphonate transport system substrate-binding protein